MTEPNTATLTATNTASTLGMKCCAERPSWLFWEIEDEVKKMYPFNEVPQEIVAAIHKFNARKDEALEELRTVGVLLDGQPTKIETP